MSYQIELRHYRYFLALAKELNFRKASERLYISQPGLSRQIKQMEEILGVTLFHRTKRNVELSTAGVFLEEELQSLFNHLDYIQRQLKYIDRGHAGEIRIGFLGSAMQRIIPDLLVALKNTYPEIHTSLEEMANHQQVEAMLQDRLDMGFVRLPSVPEVLVQKNLHTDTFCLVVPKSHWLNRENFRSIRQVSDEQFILFTSDYSPHYFETIRSIFKDAGFEPHISHKTVHAQTIFKLVEQELGIAIIPHSLQHGFDLKIKVLSIPNIGQTSTLSAIWNRNNHNPCLSKMVEIINSTMI